MHGSRPRSIDSPHQYIVAAIRDAVDAAEDDETRLTAKHIAESESPIFSYHETKAHYGNEFLQLRGC